MNNKQLQIYLQVFAYKNIIGLIVSYAFYVFIKADMLCPARPGYSEPKYNDIWYTYAI